MSEAVAAAVVERRAPVPEAPGTLEATGLSFEQLRQLFVKSLYTGEATGLALAERLRLPFALLEQIVEHVRLEKLVEVRGATGGGSAGYKYALTDLGRDRGQQYLDANQYIGPAPVPLAQYCAYVRHGRDTRGFLDRARLRDGFTHLIVAPDTLDQLGPAVNSGKAIFLYGPPGNGKTVLAEGVGRALGGDMFVPHAIDIDGQVVTMFDPVNHVTLEPPADSGPSIIKSVQPDRRWVRIKRPVVTVGGELTLEMLDLSFNQISKFYEAPLQLKANGGVFVVDDFGRQRIRPRDLLNRWIVPLESRIDFLTMHTGKKFEIPFDVLIVFATNLNPESLADEAFLRRIPYKIYAKNPTPEEFSQIFALNCRQRSLVFDPVVVEYLVRRYYEPRGIEMRACQPRDLVEQVVNLCRYDGRDPAISRELLDKACASYFLDEQAAPKRPPVHGGPHERARRAMRRRRGSNGRRNRDRSVRRRGPARGRLVAGAGAHTRVRGPRIHQQPLRDPRDEHRVGIRAHGPRDGVATARQRDARGRDDRRQAAGRHHRPTWQARVVAAVSILGVPLIRPIGDALMPDMYTAARLRRGARCNHHGQAHPGPELRAHARASWPRVHRHLRMGPAPDLCRVPGHTRRVPHCPPGLVERGAARRRATCRC